MTNRRNRRAEKKWRISDREHRLEDNCFFHGYEPVPKDFYRLCAECGHCFVTEQELIEKDAVWLTAIGIVGTDRPGTDILACPECTHDF